jgi:ADP-dependent NAD(P)H-hydrate dehydratase / NAD(P)H-hydrate epimerase
VSLLVVATYPASGGRVLEGPVALESDGMLTIDGKHIPASQGTSAMLGAACQVCDYLGVEPPVALVAGDIGRGDGTRAVFARLAEVCERTAPTVVAFHYMQPIMALMRHAVAELAECASDTTLMADAGGMYAAKAAGLAPRFELMTPDVGEVGFLADPDVTHPAYVSHYLFGTNGFDPVELARKAADTGGSSSVLLIKGVRDHIARDGDIVEVVEAPCVPELEAIGGTGDTITGLAAAFLGAGFPTVEAAVCASRSNRAAGAAMGARPDHRASDLVAELPRVFEENLCAWAGVCATPQ